MAGHRSQRVSEDIKREIVALIRELKDPRVSGKMLTVVRVDVSSDASFAKVFVSALEGIETAENAVKGLNGAAGFIRGEEDCDFAKAPSLNLLLTILLNTV